MLSSPSRLFDVPIRRLPVLACFALLCVVLFPAADALTAIVAWPLGCTMAALATDALHFLGVETSTQGNLLTIPAAGGLRMRISDECVALPAYATLISLELATQRHIAGKLLASLLACLGFLALNVARIVSLATTAVHAPAVYETLHVLVWNFVLFVIITGFVVTRLIFAQRARADSCFASETQTRGRGQAFVVLCGLFFVLALPPQAQAVSCPPKAGDGAVATPDIDGDGTADVKFPGLFAPCELFCVSNFGRVKDFILKCNGCVVHRCPYIGALNRFNPGALYSGSSTESEAAAPGVPADDDKNGVIEKVEYEEVVEGGVRKLIIRTFHDGVLVETKKINCPGTVAALPWPKRVPPPVDTPVLPLPWMVAMFSVVAGVFGFRFWRTRQRHLVPQTLGGKS